MSLREEIFDIVYEGRRDYANKWKKTDLDVTEEIISKFEKRIDEMIKEEEVILRSIVENERTDNCTHSRYRATIDSLTRVKEMLK